MSDERDTPVAGSFPGSRDKTEGREKIRVG